eukprot:4966823-Pleurochrysis_carterae.AAC.2
MRLPISSTVDSIFYNKDRSKIITLFVSNKGKTGKAMAKKKRGKLNPGAEQDGVETEYTWI